METDAIRLRGCGILIRGGAPSPYSKMLADLDYARQLDAQDELAHFREEFAIDDPDLIYLDGNSLGRMPKRALARLREVAEEEWGRRLIRGWNEGWFTLP